MAVEMGTICWEDVADLSIFKCKICTHRLQYPVMEVKTLGNICGGCYEKSAYTNVSQNTDIERILSKLYIPCKYTERGCYFEGSLEEITNHEIGCSFGDKPCPFSLIGKCENTKERDVVDHIKNEHREHFIETTVKENCVIIRNAMEMKNMVTYPSIFYIFEFNREQFLFRSKIDERKQLHHFSLYYLDNRASNKISFSFIAKHEGLTTVSEKIGALHYRELSNVTDNDSLRISAKTLTNLGCTQELKIKCEMIRCIEFVEKNKYNEHTENWRFKLYDCPFKESSRKCTWTGYYTDIATHALNAHKEDTFQHRMSILQNLPRYNASTSSYMKVIIRNNIILICKYKFDNGDMLNVRVDVAGPQFLSTSYIWELHLLKDDGTFSSMILSGITGGIPMWNETIAVTKYIHQNQTLKFAVSVRKKN